MPLKPATMFACGCSLTTGVKTILVFHLVACLLYVGSTFCDIVLHKKSFGIISSWSPVWQFTLIGFNMCGVVIILAAMYGIRRRIDVAIRFYLGYLLITFVLNTVALLDIFILKDNGCVTHHGAFGQKLTADFGLAFMCGFLRIMSYLFVTAAICLEVYCLYIVWSLCEDIHEGPFGPGIYSLLDTKEHAFEKEKDHMHNDRNSDWHVRDGWVHFGEGPYADIAGLNHTKCPGAYPSPYGALEAVGFGEANPMFGGQYAMSY